MEYRDGFADGNNSIMTVLASAYGIPNPVCSEVIKRHQMKTRWASLQHSACHR